MEMENEEDISVQASGIGTAYVQGEYVKLFPVVEEDGEYKIVPYGYQFVGAEGSTYVSGTANAEIQNQLITVTEQNGYEPLGWYITGSIYLEVDKPDRFTFNIYPKENDKLYSTTAQNDSNVFNFMTLYPTDTTASYSLGMRGHVYYTTMYPNAPVSGQKSTCLLVYFE